MSRPFAPLSFRAGRAFGAGAALALVLTAGAARADVVSNINPANCRSAQFDQVSLFTRGTGATHTIQAKSTNTQNYTVYCPITKKSSGPGVIANDGIKTVAVTTSTAGLVDCTIMTRRVSVAFSVGDGVVFGYFPAWARGAARPDRGAAERVARKLLKVGRRDVEGPYVPWKFTALVAPPASSSS